MLKWKPHSTVEAFSPGLDPVIRDYKLRCPSLKTVWIFLIWTNLKHTYFDNNGMGSNILTHISRRYLSNLTKLRLVMIVPPHLAGLDSVLSLELMHCCVNGFPTEYIIVNWLSSPSYTCTCLPSRLIGHCLVSLMSTTSEAVQLSN